MIQPHVLTNNVVAQANIGVGLQPNGRIQDFMRMNLPTFHDNKVDEDPQVFIDEVFKVADVMGVTPREKAKLSAYQLKDVTQVWFHK